MSRVYSRLVYRVLLGTLIYALVYVGLSLFLWKDRRRLAWGLVGGGGLTLVLMLALGLGALFDFDWLFWQFHLSASPMISGCLTRPGTI